MSRLLYSAGVEAVRLVAAVIVIERSLDCTDLTL